MNYTVIDIETNGANPENDDVILLSATKIVDGKIAETFSKLVKPSRPQTEELELFTGITNKELESAEEMDTVMKEFFDFSKDSAIVSYDDFEYFFLESKGFKSEKVIYLREYIKKTYPEIGKYIADGVLISLGLEGKLKEHLVSEIYYGKTHLFYSLKVALIFLAVIENFE